MPENIFSKTLQKQSVGKLENPEPPDFIHYQVDLSHDDYSKCYRKLKKAVMKAPRVLDIELTFCVITSPEFCLMVHELLTERKSPQTQVQVTSRCSLLDGSVLLLLAGEKRFVSPYTWMQLTSPRRVDEEPVENRRVRNHVFRTADGTYFRTNYASCLRLISRYLPLNRVAGRRLNMRQILGEYDLLAS